VKEEDATTNEGSHVSTNGRSVGGADAHAATTASVTSSVAGRQWLRTTHRMQNRGMPYSEEMVEDS